MTWCKYLNPLLSFDSSNLTATIAFSMKAKSFTHILVTKEGRTALETVNTEMRLGFDDFDFDVYTELFREKLSRDPTDVECFDT